MKDLKGEQFIVAQDNDRLLLSNIRLQYWTTNTYRSIRLENINFIEYTVRYNDRLIWWSLCVAVAIAGLNHVYLSSDGQDSSFLIFVIIFAIGMTIYYLTKRAVLRFSTAIGQIAIDAARMSDHEAYEFIDKVEDAVHEVKRKVFAAAVKV